LEELGLYGTIIFKIDLQEMGWIILAEDRDKWWAIVSVVMNIYVSKSVRNSLTS